MFYFDFNNSYHYQNTSEKLTSSQPSYEAILSEFVLVRKFSGYKIVEYLAGFAKNEVCIGQACSKDIPELVAIDKKSFISSWDKDDFQRKINMGPPYYCFLTADKNEIKAYVIFEVKDNNIDILRLVVAPEYRRQGIATGILAELSKKSSLQKCKTISILIEQDNIEARSFLNAVGFDQFRSMKNSPSKEILHLYSDDFANFTSLYKNQANTLKNELFYETLENKSLFAVLKDKINTIFRFFFNRFR